MPSDYYSSFFDGKRLDVEKSYHGDGQVYLYAREGLHVPRGRVPEVIDAIHAASGRKATMVEHTHHRSGPGFAMHVDEDGVYLAVHGYGGSFKLDDAKKLSSALVSAIADAEEAKAREDEAKNKAEAERKARVKALEADIAKVHRNWHYSGAWWEHLAEGLEKDYRKREAASDDRVLTKV